MICIRLRVRSPRYLLFFPPATCHTHPLALPASMLFGSLTQQLLARLA